jgi:hypothetical protein
MVALLPISKLEQNLFLSYVISFYESIVKQGSLFNEK